MAHDPNADGGCRLYLITPPRIDDADAFAEALQSALDAGDVACLQLRMKTEADDIDVEATRRVFDRVAALSRARDVAVLINDSPELARELRADGVHIGQSDFDAAKARRLLGDDAILGVTCHASKDLAFEAGEAGADYVAFGAFFPTATKEPIARAEPELLAWWTHATTLPSVAIGGITPENCGPLVAAGADFLAVSAAVWARPGGPAKAVSDFLAAMAAAEPSPSGD